MSIIAEMIMKNHDLTDVAEVLQTSEFQKQMGALSLNLYLSDDIATLKYLAAHVREGDPHINPFEYIGKEHKLLLKQILVKCFKDTDENFAQQGLRYQLLKQFLTALSKRHDAKPKIAECKG